ncbi:flagellar-associated protein FlgQ [Campylobacter subantarcticus LMG 24377]|uniref:Flagellar-associated protein FlgQ n=2 Tax=Campylobacter subantarcticus TaxID=497724 RepID=A0A0A8HAZ4_9BACT|nr:hypothetical protein [Campylobacter subantarcticus]EAJ1261667.1 hypothetical protein [Campylobacter lari]AJC91137.1 flagellar-associated protein FlgQ [Campylobacter subantarcticus LMG 24374]AJC92915.1 flagellar-associated protein FlgQ [Campylobacter subantarcticus LMG 24377]EAL3939693.1 hypothetical protein [Campylobacter lari]MPB99903.1 hypothetical protein [Campylobacter subantarcticus]
MERIVCLLIFIVFNTTAQDEFIFWAELSNRNLILFHQNETISMAMTQSKNKNLEYACELIYTPKDLKTFLRDDFGMIDEERMTKLDKFNFLNTHKNELIDCFFNSKIDVKDFVKSEQASAQSETYVRILPLRFTVEFHDNSAFIYYLK